MEQILVAVDEHPHAKKVVDYAIGLAKANGAKIILAHGITQKSVPVDLRDEYRDSKGKVDVSSYYEDVFERTVEDLQRTIAKANVACESLYEVGDPAKFILATAKSKKVNSIVVGIHGLRRLGKIMALSEVARNVIEGSTVPVIAVP